MTVRPVLFDSAYGTRLRQGSHCGCANITFAFVGHDGNNMDVFALERGSVTFIFEG